MKEATTIRHNKLDLIDSVDITIFSGSREQLKALIDEHYVAVMAKEMCPLDSIVIRCETRFSGSRNEPDIYLNIYHKRLETDEELNKRREKFRELFNREDNTNRTTNRTTNTSAGKIITEMPIEQKTKTTIEGIVNYIKSLFQK